jgi:hypothetical protein
MVRRFIVDEAPDFMAKAARALDVGRVARVLPPACYNQP